MNRHPYGRPWSLLTTHLRRDLVRRHRGSSTTGRLRQPGTRSLAKISWLCVDGQLPLSLPNPRRGFSRRLCSTSARRSDTTRAGARRSDTTRALIVSAGTRRSGDLRRTTFRELLMLTRCCSTTRRLTSSDVCFSQLSRAIIPLCSRQLGLGYLLLWRGVPRLTHPPVTASFRRRGGLL